MSLHLKNAAELARGIRSGEFTSSEVTRHFLERIEQGNGALNAFITVIAGGSMPATCWNLPLGNWW